MQHVTCALTTFCGRIRPENGIRFIPPYAKKCACNMHLTDNNMRKATCMLNECCNRFLHSCNMRGFETVNKHVTCMATFT